MIQMHHYGCLYSEDKAVDLILLGVGDSRPVILKINQPAIVWIYRRFAVKTDRPEPDNEIPD